MSRVLIVEDDASMVRLLQTLLGLEGHQAFSTARPDDVISTVRESQPQVVVMDLHLGQVNTLGIIKEIKGDPVLKSVPLIIVSGLDAEDECKLAGAEAFILKPYSPGKLLDLIKQLAI